MFTVLDAISYVGGAFQRAGRVEDGGIQIDRDTGDTLGTELLPDPVPTGRSLGASMDQNHNRWVVKHDPTRKRPGGSDSGQS